MQNCHHNCSQNQLQASISTLNLIKLHLSTSRQKYSAPPGCSQKLIIVNPPVSKVKVSWDLLRCEKNSQTHFYCFCVKNDHFVVQNKHLDKVCSLNKYSGSLEGKKSSSRISGRKNSKHVPDIFFFTRLFYSLISWGTKIILVCYRPLMVVNM